jgi:hypothetical protein
MNHSEMVVLIVAIVMFASVMRARLRARPRESEADDGEKQRLREEVRALKERVAVLERIATDRSSALEQEIENLRDR